MGIEDHLESGLHIDPLLTSHLMTSACLRMMKRIKSQIQIQEWGIVLAAMSVVGAKSLLISGSIAS